MNKSITSFVKSVFAGMTLALACVATQAAPISYTYESSTDFEQVTLGSLFGWGWLGNLSHTFQPDFSHSNWISGGEATSYDPEIDTLASLDVTLHFEDDTNLPIELTFAGLRKTASSAASVVLTGFDINGFSLAQLEQDLVLKLKTTNTWMQYTTLTGYALTVSGTRELAQQAVPVPTPSTLALLSVGLLGAGWFSRRRNETAHS